MRLLNGAEDEDYLAAGFLDGAKDGPLEAVEELQQVMGMTYELYQPGFPRKITISHSLDADSDIRINTLRRYWGLGHGVPDG